MQGMLRGRRQRKLRVWCYLCLGGLCCVVFASLERFLTIWGRLSGTEVKLARSSGQSCDPSTLPPSIQLHCRMHRLGIITGSLCSPLCERGHICDVRSTYGNAHKEVMVTQCHEFCGQGQSVKAILKHDEVYATTDGYEKFYNALNVVDKTFEDGTEFLKTLLHRHLPNTSTTDTFLMETLAEESASSVGNFSDFAFHNTLMLLFRQKEYVLFEAYKDMGIFPRIYGACGPLYLVEFCDPVLKQGKRYDEVFLLNSLLSRSKENDVEPEQSRQETAYNSGDVLQYPKADKPILKTGSIFFDGIMEKFLGDKSTYKNIQPSFSSIEQKLVKGDKLATLSEIDTNSPGSEPVYVTNFNPADIDKKSSSHLPWSDRAQAAIKIFHFLEYLERQETFPEHIHVCDPKLEHFAVGREDGRLKLIDADLILFDFNVATESGAPDVDTGACAEHEDCSDVMCRGWCWKEKGRCASRRVNNNLQGICENVFLRPSLKYGAVFTAIPTAVYDDVRKLLCQCATNVTGLWEGVPIQMPPASTRKELVGVLEKSLREEKKSPGLRIHVGGGHDEDFDFLLEYCKSSD